MRNFKRFLTLALAVLMVASSFAFGASAAQFTDVDENNAYLTKAVELLNYVGVIKGTSETTFGTDELVTREQMAAFIYRLMKKGQSVEGGTNSSRFTDLEDPTYYFMISWADSQGIIKGESANAFNPKGSITLQDAYTMVVRALGYEKEASLPYPFGYIGVAEDKGVELGEGLSSDITYTDNLTRGDVAIILYNAFFAETGVAETEQVEYELSDGSYVLKSETTYPLLCEKVFDVKEIEYQAVATPHYVFGEDETTADLGYEAILMDKVDDSNNEDIVKAAQQFYVDAAEIGLEGKADEYIMSYFTVYAVLKDSDTDNSKEVDKVLFAQPLLKKKTVNEIKLETVTDNNQKSYYLNDAGAIAAKRLSGKAVVDGAAVYFFNAPYSYAQPSYLKGDDDVAKYEKRNDKNVKFIGFSVLGSDYEDGEYEIDLAADLFDADEIENEMDNGYEAYSEALIYKLAQVYTDGLYAADFYDVDGDGIYDYINYKPYSFYFVDDDEDYEFYSDGYETKDGKTYVYTNGAVVVGDAVKEDDLVLGYFNKSANTIEVAEIVKPVAATIANINKTNEYITLSSGEKVYVTDAWKLVANYSIKSDLADAGYDLEEVSLDSFYAATDFDSLLSGSAYDNDKTDYYFYNDVLLFAGDINSNNKFNGDLIIVTEDEDGNSIETGSFNSATGERTTFVYAYVNGVTKWVAVDTDAEVYPAIDKNIDKYLNKLATYSVDSDGLYTIQLLGNAYDDKAMGTDDYIGMDKYTDVDLEEIFESEKDTDQVLYDLDTTIDTLSKKVGKRFALDTFDLGYDFLLNKDSKVLVLSHFTEDGDDEEIGFKEYTVDDLTESLTCELYNIQFVVANNTDYTNREDLVLFFAETDEDPELESKSSTKSERIVVNYEAVADENGKYYLSYTLLNPYTGASENALSSKSYSKASNAESAALGSKGKFVKVAGNTVDKSLSMGTVNDNANLYWILDYDADSDMIEVVKVGDEDGTSYRLSTDNVVVTQLGNQSTNKADIISASLFSKLAVSDLGSTSKSLKTIKTDYLKPDAKENASFKTVYGKYLKAYISIDWEDETDHTEVDEDTNCNGEADFAVIIVHKAEAEEYCDTTK